MDIKKRLKRLETEVVGASGCACYALTIKDYPERLPAEWLTKDVCNDCGKSVDASRVKEIFALYKLADERLAVTETDYRQRQI